MPMKIDNRHAQIGGRHRATSRYYMILSRVKNTDNRKNANYAGVEVRVSKDEFIAWFMQRDFAGCSVDRIDKNGHYELSNMQVIPLAQNIAKDKVIMRDGQCRCFRCNEWKSVSAFVKDARRSTGIATICKPCEVERTRMNGKYQRINRRLAQIHGVSA